MKKTTILAMVAILAAVAVPAIAQAAPAERTPISGTSGFVSLTPGEVRVTPSGVIQESGGVAVLWDEGDLQGEETLIYMHSFTSADWTRLVSQASAQGTVTWDGRTGTVTGIETATCELTDTGGYYCSGSHVLHGFGDLEGVSFHLNWSGIFPFEPFTYEGFALDTNPK